MVQEITSLVAIGSTMFLFVFIAFSLKENVWLKNMFFAFSLLMVPVLMFVSMSVATINGLTSLASLLERIYGAMLGLYLFVTFILIIKFIIFMFNLFKLNRERGVDIEPHMI